MFDGTGKIRRFEKRSNFKGRRFGHKTKICR